MEVYSNAFQQSFLSYASLQSLKGPSQFCFALGLAILLCIFSYNHFLHPLRKYPGPSLAGITAAVRHYHMLTGQEIAWIHRLHLKYGPIVRITPHTLSFIEAQAWRDIYGMHGSRSNPNTNPKNDHVAVEHPDHVPLLILQDDHKHAQRRRTFAPAFSDSALRKQEPVFQYYCQELVSALSRQIAEKPSAPVNLVDYLNFTTFDMMADFAFSDPLNMLQSSSYHPWVKFVTESPKLIMISRVLLDYPFATELLMALVPGAKKKEHDFRKFSKDQVNRRLGKTASANLSDMCGVLLKQQDKGAPSIPAATLYEDARIMMIAGTETTATLLAGLLYHLACNPETMATLRRELFEAFPDREDVSTEKLNQLPYLKACIDEGLRIYPPVPLGLQRRMRKGGGAVCGEWLPENTIVQATQYAAFHSPSNFRSPDEFHPERWLRDAEQRGRFAEDTQAACQPFSYGPRNCLGMNMAWMEMRLIAAHLLLNFDFELCEESKNWADQKAFILWEKPPLLFRLRPFEEKTRSEVVGELLK